MSTGPLEGIRVLDLTRVLAGPFASMLLGDLGAEVIKVEIPGSGDDARGFGPFLGQDSAYFLSLNRNKLGVTLDLKKERGRELFLELARCSDVVLENFRPGTMERLGVGYAALRQVNPRLVYAACSGFGRTGPYAARPAYDVIVQGMGGIMSITGPPGGPPTRVGASIGDITAALFTTIGILAALHERQSSGEGQLVDVAMFDCQVAILENAIARYQVTGEVPVPLGNRHPSITPFTSLPTADGQVIIAVGNDHLWGRFCEAIGREDLVADGRFTTNAARTENWDALEPVLQAVFATRTTGAWLKVLEAATIPCGPVNTVDRLFADPQLAARGMLVASDGLTVAGCPVKLSRTPARVGRPAPALGAHTGEVLARLLGLAPGEIEELRADRVI